MENYNDAIQLNVLQPMTPQLVTDTQYKKWHCSRRMERFLLVSADIVAMLTSFFLADILLLSVKKQFSISDFFFWKEPDFTRILMYGFLVTVTIAVFWTKGHYSKRRPYWTEIRELMNVTLILALLDAALVFLGKLEFSRASLLATWLLAPCFLVIMRSFLKYVLISIGAWCRPMVIVGWGRNALQTAKAFDDESLIGFRLAAFLVPVGQKCFEEEYRDHQGHTIACLTLGDNIEEMLKSMGDPHIVLALEQGGIDAYQGLIQQLSGRYKDVQIVPSVHGLPLYGMEVNHFFSHEVMLLTVRNNLARRGPQLLKRCFDLIGAILILIVGAPVLLWIAVKIAGAKGAIFFGHKRVGQNGKHFFCYKFSTMLPNADKLLQEVLAKDPAAQAEWERDFKLKNDPRITPIGHFLRKTSLDELPQLWNVVKGEMSLVGPRPIVDAELERYGNQVDYYLEAKPGITGLWQISGRNDTTYENRVYLDAWYVKNWSLFNDLVILLKTIKVVFKNDGAY